jgi:hypothetical protein
MIGTFMKSEKIISVIPQYQLIKTKHPYNYRMLDGHRYGGAFKFGKPALIIRDPELIKDILVRDFTSFHDNEIQIDIDADPMFGRNPFVLRGER